MPSPFPGMDPYLEEPGGWAGVHDALIAIMREALNRDLGRDFIADGGTRVYVVTPEEIYQPHILIRDRASRRVVTVIELLSPVNKAPETAARAEFLRQRHEIMSSEAHWLEIDLLRAGERPPEVRGAGSYYALLKRGGAHDLFAWPCGVRDPLPTIAVPLVPPFDDVALDLQLALDELFARYRYAELLDYSVPPPPPPFELADAHWVAEQVRRWQAARTPPTQDGKDA